MLLFEHFVAPSRIHGVGVFSRFFIPKGQIIWKYNPLMDKRIHASDLADLPEYVQIWIRQRAEYFPSLNLFVVPSDGDLFMNHSRDPNMSSDGDECFSLRDISAGEEVTCDYRSTQVLGFDSVSESVGFAIKGESIL